MIVYAFEYSDCIHESAHATMSLHKTQRGAEIALDFHKAECRKEFYELFSEGSSFNIEFGAHESWRISEIQIEE